MYDPLYGLYVYIYYLLCSTTPNVINWVAEFNGVVPSTIGDEIENYVLNDLSTEIFRDKNVIQIGDNFLYHSDHTSTVEMTFDLVDDVSNLIVPDSPAFLAYEESFCSNVSYAFI